MKPTLDDLLEQLRQIQKDIGNFASWEPHMFPDEADEAWDQLQQEEADLLSAINQMEQQSAGN